MDPKEGAIRIVAHHENDIAMIKWVKSNFSVLVAWGIVAILLFGILIPAFNGPYDIQASTGRLRQQGIFGRVGSWLDFGSLSEHERKLRSLAISAGIGDEWIPITVYAPSDGGRSVATQYRRLVPWVDEEPELARRMLVDFVDYLRNARSRGGSYPESGYLLIATDPYTMQIDLDRLNGPDTIREALNQIHHTPRPGGLLDKYLTTPQSAAPSPAQSNP